MSFDYDPIDELAEMDHEHQLRGVSDEDISLAVKQGMYWLDENVPRWLQVVDVIKLDLNNVNACMLGQQWNAIHETGSHYISPYSDYLSNEVGVSPGERGDWATRHGFNLSGNRHTTQDWVELTEEWKHQATMRKEANEIQL